LGETAYYGWGSGKDAVMGPSINLAMAAARAWGNCAVQPEPIQELPDAWVFAYAFIDLETGFTISRQFRQSKSWTVHGKMDDARKEDMRFQIGQSKAQRNTILSVLPKSLINAAMSAARKGVREKVEQFVKVKGIAAAQDLLIRGLAKHGVTEQAILDRVGVAAVKAIDVEEIVRLRGDLHAIEDGQERAEALFPGIAKGAGPSANAVDQMLNDEPDQSQPVGFQGHVGPEKEAGNEPDPEPKPAKPAPAAPTKRGKSSKGKAAQSKAAQSKADEPTASESNGTQTELSLDDEASYPDGFQAALANCRSVGQVESTLAEYTQAENGDHAAVQAACDQRTSEIRAEYRQM